MDQQDIRLRSPDLVACLETVSHPSDLVLADRHLVDRCLSGDASAWSDLYGALHTNLLASIRSFLGRYEGDASLVDEIAARVWYALIKNDFALLARFDVHRGCRLQSFVCLLARAEARLVMRSERRRRVREHLASRRETSRSSRPALISEEEFLTTLTPAERLFYEQALTASLDDGGEAQYSQENRWQLRHRVRKKLEKFLQEGS